MKILRRGWIVAGLALCYWPALSLAQPVVTAAGVVDAAGYTGGKVSPGEIIVIFGTGIGPADLVPLEVLGGRVTTELGGVRVLFDGLPAPLVYVWGTQVSAIVPYAVAGAASTDLVVEYEGLTSAAVTLPVVPTVPGVFTLDASGFGPGAILNQDGSLNSATNPADLGDIIVLFATGEGQTIPPGQDGLIAVSQTLPEPELEVTAAWEEKRRSSCTPGPPRFSSPACCKSTPSWRQRSGATSRPR